MLTCHVYLLSIVIATIETDTIKKVTKTNMAHINAMAWKNSLKSFFAVNNKEDNDEDGGDNLDTEFKVLCIGDSLTEGYYGILHHYHPYTMKLQEMITNSLGNRVKVYTRGKGGEKVHEEMMERLRSELNQTEYDLVLIMGGVNDLVNLDCINEIDLFKDIKTLHSLAHKRGVKTVAMTILEAYVKEEKLSYVDSKEFEKLRISINQKIKAMNETEVMLVCDTAMLFPYKSLSDTMKNYLWTNDKVHPTPRGYDQLGRVIFHCIYEKIRSELKVTNNLL